MAAADGPQTTSLARRLQARPDRFEFFQAVRMLQLAAARAGAGSIGTETAPERERVRFRTHISAAFPRAAIERAAVHDIPELTVSFMGLTGPQGVLPQHFTRLLIDQERGNEHVLAAFQDLFNHRMISLFYRAWEKYRCAIAYERARAAGGADPFTLCAASTAGFGLDALRGRLSFDDELFTFFAGHFARGPHCAAALEDLLASYFGEQVAIEPFVGQWLRVGDAAVSRIGLAPAGGAEPQLGRNTMVGELVWDVQSRFRIRIGPMAYAAYCRMLPDGAALAPLAQMVRTYVGAELDFDVQLTLRGSDVPPCELGGAGGGARLGWTTFLCAAEMKQDVDAASFSFEQVHIAPRPMDAERAA